MRFLAAVLVLCPGLAFAGQKYPQTVAALQEGYALKLRSHLLYIACARKAQAEGRRNAAHLFTALVDSESANARSFKAILNELGFKPSRTRWPDVPSRDTRANLKAAAAEELRWVSESFPALIEKARPEGHEAALLNLTQALESERRHLELLRRADGLLGRLAESASGFVRKARLRLAVCENCGFISTKRPAERCRACRGPASAYHDPATF